jgi:hypothetical protein
VTLFILVISLMLYTSCRDRNFVLFSKKKLLLTGSTGRSIEMGNVRKHNGVGRHGYGPCRIHFSSLKFGNFAMRIGGQDHAVQQHDLALQVAVFWVEMVLVSHAPGSLCALFIRGSVALACYRHLGCGVSTEVDQEQSYPWLNNGHTGEKFSMDFLAEYKVVELCQKG